jgi:acetyl esterase/lipase
MTNDAEKDAARERQASRFDLIASEAESAAAHARTAAVHFRNFEIPRAGAHAFALEGHLANIRRVLDEAAVEHAGRSRPLP